MLPPDSILLDTQRPGPGEKAGALLFSAPRRVLVARTPAEVEALLEALDREARGGGWCAGYLTYEAASPPSDLPPTPPLAWFGVYAPPERLTPGDLEERLAAAGEAHVAEPRFTLDFPAYRERIAAVKRRIREGDVYQINLTAPLQFGFEGDPVGLYRDLRRKQGVAFGAVLRVGERWVLSLSPELFVRRDGERLTARPMKGTARRGPDARTDAEVARWLTADPKNRAENLMIVDLLRNDLAKVSEPGSVRVSDLFAAERYETLWQMTSTVTAAARPGAGVAAVMAALFPCGSVTGAPKLRAMELIRALEDEPRGVYCGAIGVVRPGGDFAFSVPIRTVELEGRGGRRGVGSGVVWDSDPDSEYAECLLKARFLTDPPLDFALLETMRAEGGEITLLEGHLERLRGGAAYFGFTLDEEAIRERLAGLPEGGGYRVRLTVDRQGRGGVELTPLGEQDHTLRHAVLYPEPLPADDPFLRHKTTHRSFYDRALAWARARGADEALLQTSDGRLAEGTFTNVWLRRGGRLLTPTLEGGGLPGVFRAHLLRTRADAAEAPLRVEDLWTADEVLVSNAVRGLQSVEVLREPAGVPSDAL